MHGSTSPCVCTPRGHTHASHRSRLRCASFNKAVGASGELVLCPTVNATIDQSCVPLIRYQADHRHAQPTFGFFLAVIVMFMLSNASSKLYYRKHENTGALLQKPVALRRWLSTRDIRLGIVDLTLPTVGILCLGMIGTIFFASMTLGPRPYYWPNTKSISYGNSPPIPTRTGLM